MSMAIDIMDLILKAVTVKVRFGPDANLDVVADGIDSAFKEAGFTHYGGGYKDDGYVIYMVTAGFERELTSENMLVLMMKLVEVKGVLQAQASDAYDLRDILNPTIKNVVAEMNAPRPL